MDGVLIKVTVKGLFNMLRVREVGVGRTQIISLVRARAVRYTEKTCRLLSCDRIRNTGEQRGRDGARKEKGGASLCVAFTFALCRKSPSFLQGSSAVGDVHITLLGRLVNLKTLWASSIRGCGGGGTRQNRLFWVLSSSF
jgi:hypothetical protein